MNEHMMVVTNRDQVAGTIFLLQSLLGLLGNFSLLFHYLCLDVTEYKVRVSDMIVKNKIVANCLVLLSGGMQDAMELLGWHHFNDLACKLFPYICRVGRGMSISTTCLLSVFQAITLRPTRARWVGLKARAPKCIAPCLVLCWIVNLLVNVIFPISLTNILNKRNTSNRKIFRYCSYIRRDSDTWFVVLFVFTDAVFLGLMVWASGSMVYILYRHKNRVQHLHRNSLSSRSSSETRATWTILLLASTFLFFYTLSSILQGFLVLLKHLDWFLLNATSVLNFCFSALSPFLLLHRDSRTSCLTNIQSCFRTRNM